jgi:hypothetical protein
MKNQLIKILGLMAIVSLCSIQSMAQHCSAVDCAYDGPSTKEEFDAATHVSWNDLRREFGAQKLIFYFLRSNPSTAGVLAIDLFSYRPTLSWMRGDFDFENCRYRFPQCPNLDYSTLSFFESLMSNGFYDYRYFGSEGNPHFNEVVDEALEQIDRESELVCLQSRV